MASFALSPGCLAQAEEAVEVSHVYHRCSQQSHHSIWQKFQKAETLRKLKSRKAKKDQQVRVCNQRKLFPHVSALPTKVGARFLCCVAGYELLSKLGVPASLGERMLLLGLDVQCHMQPLLVHTESD